MTASRAPEITATLGLFAGLEEQIRALVREEVNELREELQRSPGMNLKETAAYLRMGEDRIYKATAARKIPHRKQEGRLLFHRDEVDAWLNEDLRGPAPAATKTGNPEIASLLEEILATPTRDEAA
jgi:excisionase family DNA binding protein